MQMEILEGKPEGRTSSLVPPDFLHYRFDYPLSEMRNLVLETMENGFFRLGAKENPDIDAKIFLSKTASTSADAAARMAWFGPRTVQPGNDTVGQASRAFVGVSARGDRLDELVPQAVIQRIDSALRLEDPSYDGIGDLFRRTLPHAPASLDGQVHLGIRAELPFEVEVNQGTTVVVRSSPLARDKSLRLIFYFTGTHDLGSSRIVLANGDSRVLPNGACEWTISPDWPERAERAKVVLFFETCEVRTAEVNRWHDAANAAVVVDRYFDPKHEHLRRLLLDRGRVKGKVSPFELGVARLMFILGIPVALYNEGAEEARPDAGGYLEKERIAVLVEATLEKPIEKFSKMAERVHQLRALLPNECRILAAVFTRAETSESERRQAIDHNVVLIGHSEILELLEMTKTKTNAALVLKYFEGVMTKTALEASGVWRSPWS
jgi:hypothetical protein